MPITSKSIIIKPQQLELKQKTSKEGQEYNIVEITLATGSRVSMFIKDDQAEIIRLNHKINELEKSKSN